MSRTYISKSYISDSKFQEKILGEYWWRNNKNTEDYWFYEGPDIIEEDSIYYVAECNSLLRKTLYFLSHVNRTVAEFLFDLIKIKGLRVNGIVDHDFGNLSRIKDGVLICKKQFDYKGIPKYDKGYHFGVHGYGDEFEHVKYKDGKPNGPCKCKWRFNK